jgi:hypothetical protein
MYTLEVMPGDKAQKAKQLRNTIPGAALQTDLKNRD